MADMLETTQLSAVTELSADDFASVNWDDKKVRAMACLLQMPFSPARLSPLPLLLQALTCDRDAAFSSRRSQKQKQATACTTRTT